MFTRGLNGVTMFVQFNMHNVHIYAAYCSQIDRVRFDHVAATLQKDRDFSFIIDLYRNDHQD